MAVKNRVASTLARLRNQAKAEGIEYQVNPKCFLKALLR